MFQFICRTGGVYFPTDSLETQVMVELSNRTTSDRIAIWPLSKLQERIYDMREFYHSNMSDKKLADPFSDRPPWFRTIGRAFINLRPLLYEIPVEHSLYIVDEQGKVVGSLRVSIVPGQTIQSSKEDLPEGALEEQHINFSGIELEPTLKSMEARFDDNNTVDPSNIRERERLRDRIGQSYTFVVNVISASGVARDFVDVFCQFRFQHHSEAAFSTESLQNTTGDLPFNHAQEVSFDVTSENLDYVERSSIIFELFGHFDESVDDEVGSSSDPGSAISPTISQTNTKETPQFHAQHNILVWFEICELVPSGE